MTFSGDTNPDFEAADSGAGVADGPSDAESNGTNASLHHVDAPDQTERDDTAQRADGPAEAADADEPSIEGIGEIRSSGPVTVINGGDYGRVDITPDGVTVSPADGDGATDYGGVFGPANFTAPNAGVFSGRISLSGESSAEVGDISADFDVSDGGSARDISSPVVFMHTGGTIGSMNISDGTQPSTTGGGEPYSGLSASEAQHGAVAGDEGAAVAGSGDAESSPTDLSTDGPRGPIPPGDSVSTGGPDDEGDGPDDTTGRNGDGVSLGNIRGDQSLTEATEQTKAGTEAVQAWLPRVGIDTTEHDVTTRPSSLNPYPELADGGVEVWHEWTPGANPDVMVHYPKIGAHVSARAPIGYEISETAERPKLHNDSDDNGTTNPDNWVPFSEFWKVESADMAQAHINDEARDQGVVDRISQLIWDNQMQDNVGSDVVRPEPRTYVRDTISAVHDEISAGRPESALMMAQQLFRGFELPQEGQASLSNTSTMGWSRDEMPRVLFPEFAAAWDERADPHQISHAGHPFSVGYAASRYVTGLLSGQALDALMTSGAAQQQSAGLREKVGYLRDQVARDTSAAEADLVMSMESARHHYTDASTSGWQMPLNLDRFVLDKLAA